MSASLVGSEMCIRDSPSSAVASWLSARRGALQPVQLVPPGPSRSRQPGGRFPELRRTISACSEGRRSRGSASTCHPPRSRGPSKAGGRRHLVE
eukprot:12180077-Alexandrium_andersonii.AAC.1